MMSILFFFKYTATPDISPLPPPDPLPIKAGVDPPPRHPEPQRCLRVLQVRRDRARAEVRPAADHGMSDEAVVCLVGVAEKDAARELPAHSAMGADRQRADRSTEHVGVRADPQRPFESRARAYLHPAL